MKLIALKSHTELGEIRSFKPQVCVVFKTSTTKSNYTMISVRRRYFLGNWRGVIQDRCMSYE